MIRKIEKNEKGSVTLIVLILCVMIVMALSGIYMRNINQLNNSKEQERIIREQYNQETDMEEIYQKVEGAENEN